MKEIMEEARILAKTRSEDELLEKLTELLDSYRSDKTYEKKVEFGFAILMVNIKIFGDVKVSFI